MPGKNKLPFVDEGYCNRGLLRAIKDGQIRW
jgi:hypothetical protein